MYSWYAVVILTQLSLEFFFFLGNLHVEWFIYAEKYFQKYKSTDTIQKAHNIFENLPISDEYVVCHYSH